MVEIDVPPGWQRRSGSTEGHDYLGENANGVMVGYKVLGPGSASVWAGAEWHDNRTLANVDGENEAKLRALEFMRQYPDATYESRKGKGRLRDGDGRSISRI